MDIKEQIHGLTEEMLTNLGRLVAVSYTHLDVYKRQSLLRTGDSADFIL